MDSRCDELEGELRSVPPKRPLTGEPFHETIRAATALEL
jgi:hypothetical protein